MAEPLLLLTRGKKGAKIKFSWGEDQQASFDALKSHLMAAPILRFPYFNKKFFVETDASKVGVGAMLSQSHTQDGISERLPVAYASRLLSEAERNYGITDLEGLVVLWAISYFETYIHGMHFTVITDHLALKALKEKLVLTGRLLCRAEKLMEYNFNVYIELVRNMWYQTSCHGSIL